MNVDAYRTGSDLFRSTYFLNLLDTALKIELCHGSPKAKLSVALHLPILKSFDKRILNSPTLQIKQTLDRSE
jgi:hypothetical protein